MAFETVLNQQPRGPFPTDQTAGPRQVVVPAGQNAQISFRMPMNVADMQDPTVGFTYEFQSSKDNVTWQPWIGRQSYTGGGPESIDKNGNPTGPNAQGSLGPGTWWLRLVFTIGKRVSVGLDWEFLVG